MVFKQIKTNKHNYKNLYMQARKQNSNKRKKIVEHSKTTFEIYTQGSFQKPMHTHRHTKLTDIR